ncbi:unnamed protein product [Ranitomeya imitator]|uniref:Immunoglobulin V-set domain-containing protein n=1 Tax=Ranitomeya imitator TaxID=111125 RepID=A0ABN9MCA4_9NEOB|nr:unnamed protein product [Ranitomeya imitator]
MHWAVLFLLTVYLTSSLAQFTVIQDGPISVSPGGSVRLTCSLSTGSVGGGNYPNWIYQILGSVPKLVIGSSGTSNQNYRPSWTSDRFTGSITGGSAVLSPSPKWKSATLEIITVLSENQEENIVILMCYWTLPQPSITHYAFNNKVVTKPGLKNNDWIEACNNLDASVVNASKHSTRNTQMAQTLVSYSTIGRKM